MIIPESFYVTSQTFNSEFLEFVWKFDENRQFLAQFRKDGSVYVEAGKIDDLGNYVEGMNWLEFSPNDSKLTDKSMWKNPKYNFVDYNFFTNGKDLIPLIKDSVEYLKSI